MKNRDIELNLSIETMEKNIAVERLRQTLKENQDYTINPIDLGLPVIPPYKGCGEIKLIILGQDPTIKNVNSRKNITCTLNLDKNNSLKTYINTICAEFSLSIDNVYATNLFKYFYTFPPATTMEVLKKHLQPNLDLLKHELDEFKDIPVITLGEPVLKLITNDKAKVRVYWDYKTKTKETCAHFTYIKALDNYLNKDLFPFPHQPSIRKLFYKNTMSDYLYFVKRELKK